MRNLTTKELNSLNLNSFARKHQNLALFLLIITLPFVHIITLILFIIDGGIIEYIDHVKRESPFKHQANLIKQIFNLKFSKG
jgi:hypothetical protein